MNDVLRRLLHLPEQATALARDIDGLHYFVITVTMLGWLGVTLAAGYFIIRFRRRYVGQRTREVHAPLAFELTVIGALLAMFLLWWLIGYRQYVRVREVPEDALEVYVTAKQWMWKFAYPDGRSSVAVLTVPQGQPVKLLMTSRDVIHSFFVPEFRIKQDVLPGRYTTAWFQADKAGTYQVLCTEYCGLLHSNMWGSVVVLEPSRFEEWLAESRPAGEPRGPGTTEAPARGKAVAEPPSVAESTRTGVGIGMAEQGRDVAERYGCLGCHTTDGRPHIGPTWRGLYGTSVELANGDRVRADEAYLTESMMDPRFRVVRGYQPVMPSYQGMLHPAEAAALVELIKSLRAEEPWRGPVVPTWEGAPERGPTGAAMPAAPGAPTPQGGDQRREPRP